MATRKRWTIGAVTATAVAWAVLWSPPFENHYGHCEGCGWRREIRTWWWMTVSDTTSEVDDDLSAWLVEDMPQPHTHEWTMHETLSRDVPFGSVLDTRVGPWLPARIYYARSELGEDEARGLVREYREIRRSDDSKRMRAFHDGYWKRRARFQDGDEEGAS